MEWFIEIYKKYYLQDIFRWLTNNINDINSVLVFMASITTIGAFLFAWFKYIQTIKKTKIAYINSIFDEIKHNLNIRRGHFFKNEEAGIYYKLYEKLKKTKKRSFYPNPTDGKKIEKEFYDLLNIKGDDLVKLDYKQTYLPIFNDAIKNALISGLCNRLLKPRIVLNLGHLNFAISRNNISLQNFNSLKYRENIDEISQVTIFFKDYMSWVHFRSYFIMLDFIRSYPRKYFTDKSEYDRLNKIIKHKKNIIRYKKPTKDIISKVFENIIKRRSVNSE